MLTSHDTQREIAAAFAAGGHGFLLKSATPEEIVDAVRAVGSGAAVLSDAVLTTLRSDVVAHSRADSAFPELTARELQVLEQLASGASNDEIARALHLSAKTVRNYLSTIFMKLEVSDRTAAALEARRRGVGSDTN